MNAKLCIFCCHGFLPEFEASILAEGWRDVVLAEFPVRCGRPALTWDELRAVLPDACSQIIVFGVACLDGMGEPPSDFPAVKVVHKDQCFHLLASPTLVNEAIANGAYLITPSWLKNWRGQVQALGFDEQRVGELFADFAKELLFLDTSLDPEMPTYLAELQTATQLPTRRIAVGLEHTRLSLAKWVLEWRLAQAEQLAQSQIRHYNRERADQVAAMDMLVFLAKTQQESQVIAAIKELFQMLFSPAALHYLRVERGVPQLDQNIPLSIQEQLAHYPSQYAWTEDGKGFMLRIQSGDNELGRILVDQLAFPEHRMRYLNLALAISGVCGLAIENARNRKRLLEAEKMASLGILVAGVAHDVNTPLGVSLTATSTLHEKLTILQRLFANRSMKQSDLDHFLTQAVELTELTRLNLERIGRLTETFRQVALEGKTLEKRTFFIKDCLDNTILSMKSLLSDPRISIKINCQANLQITSFLEDWSSIFMNLIQNSLTHGFKNRESGVIDIDIQQSPNYLAIDYRDNGNGMPAEVLSRIFDPFFTTGLQSNMGLGLYQVFNLITQRMNGEIHCSSQPGQGVHFQITLPQ